MLTEAFLNTTSFRIAQLYGSHIINVDLYTVEVLYRSVHRPQKSIRAPVLMSSPQYHVVGFASTPSTGIKAPTQSHTGTLIDANVSRTPRSCVAI